MDLRPLLMLLVLPLPLVGCGDDRFIVVGTATASSTSGFVEIDNSDSSGADIIVHMEQLHPPSRIDPSATSYVVWLDGHQGAPVRAGALAYNPDQRIGLLETHSPFLKFMVKITAEASATPSAPSNVIVATQDITID